MSVMRFRIVSPEQLRSLMAAYGLWGDRAVENVASVWRIARNAGPTPWDNEFEARFEQEDGEEPEAYLYKGEIRVARIQYGNALEFCRKCMMEIVEEVPRV